MGRVIVLSHKLSANSPVYPEMRPLNVRPLKSIEEGASSNSWIIEMGNHVGTHIDAPKHFDNEGRKIAEFTIEELTFKEAVVIDIPKGPREPILKEEIERFCDDSKSFSLLMIRTGFQRFRDEEPRLYSEHGPYLSISAARYLAGLYPRLRALGIDTISISSPAFREEGREAHRALLVKRDFLIIEDMDLASKPSRYKEVIVAPLMINEIDSAPCFVIGYAY